MRKVIESIASLLILLFVYAGLNKLIDYGTFRLQLGKSPFITGIAGFIAWELPLGELIIAGLLFVKKTRLLGLYASFFLMTLFTGYIYVMLRFSYYLPCSCGGVLSKMSWEQHLIFNIGFTILSLIGILLQDQITKYRSMDTAI